MGGGIFNMFGTLTLINSTLSGNTAQGGNGGSHAGTAAAAMAALSSTSTATPHLTYVTIANNNAIASSDSTPGTANGSGVYNLAFGNTITTGGTNTATLALNNSVIGQDVGGNDLVSDAENGKNTNTAAINGSSSVVQGGALQVGNGTNTLTPGAITVTDFPDLAKTLSNNGGPTPTLEPQSGSPVLGTGTASPALPAVDQRDLARPTPAAKKKPDAAPTRHRPPLPPWTM